MSWGIFPGAFTGSLIELVEILAVDIVVGRIAGWPNALVSSGSAISLTVVTSFILGKNLTLVPVYLLEVIAGAVLLLVPLLLDPGCRGREQDSGSGNGEAASSHKGRLCSQSLPQQPCQKTRR